MYPLNRIEKQVTLSEIEAIEDRLLRTQALDFYSEDAQKTVYRTDIETMEKRLLALGLVIDYILTHTKVDKPLLLRVFNEQYEKGANGTVSVRPKKSISAKSVQNPNDPDAEYRRKAGKKVKGFSTNITETCEEEDKPSLFDLVQTDDKTLEVTDKSTGEVITAIHVNGDKWKVKVQNKKGKNATIFQYCFHTRNNKTRYRGGIKHKMQALARCAWINVHRLFLFDLKNAIHAA